MDDWKVRLIEEAIKVGEMAYSPYSNYKVGAALLAESGSVYTGCNIECASYGATNCGERTAFFKAISEGERSFKAIAVVGKNGSSGDEFSDYAYPCGICRQVMQEFCNEDFVILVAKSMDDFKEYQLIELLPHSFSSNISNQ